MKLTKTLTILLITILLVSCGGKKKENISSDEIIGKWQPEKLEFKNIPALLKTQIKMENLEGLLSEDQKTGWLELRADSTYTMKDTRNSEGWDGVWSFNGKTIQLKNSEIQLAFNIESVSKNSMEIDYASMAKAMVGIEKLPVFDVKMVMSYKRIE